MEETVKVIEHGGRAEAGGLEEALGIGSVKLHFHGEVVAIGAAIAEDAALFSPEGEPEKRTDGGKEEAGIDVARLRGVEVFAGALGNLMDGGAGAGAGAEMNGLAKGGGIEGEAGYGGGNVIDGDDVEDGIGVAGDGAPEAAGIDFEGPVHHFEAGGDAGAGVADDDAGAEDDAGEAGEAGADEGFSFGFALLVGVAVTLADGKFAF